MGSVLKGSDGKFISIYQFSKAELERKYWEDGMTLSAIAEEKGVGEPLILYWFKKYGIPRRLSNKYPVWNKEKEFQFKVRKLPLTKSELNRLYWGQNLSSIEIAKLCSCSKFTILHAMRAWDIPRRTLSQACHVKIQEGRGELFPPTKGEQQLMALIETNSLPYKYVGDGQFWIGNANPDFININHTKQLIEVFGEYWHNVLDVAKRINQFRQYGFSCLIIWESELQNETKVVRKIRRFTGQK